LKQNPKESFTFILQGFRIEKLRTERLVTSDHVETQNNKMKTSLQPWLSVQNSAKALMFYQQAFGAVETYRMESPDGGLVLKLSVNGTEFWVSGQATEPVEISIPASLGDSVKFILTVDDPDYVFKQCITAGAKEVFPVGEAYGWRLGRVVDPFGFHWEIGREL
jgi:PhnB protein